MTEALSWMKGYAFVVTCARCGGNLDHVNSSDATVGTEVRAVGECSSCHHQWLITVYLRPAGNAEATQRRKMYRERAKA